MLLLVVAASGALMLAPQLKAPRSPPPLLLAKKSGGAAPKTTQVVLTGDVKDVGKKGELVSVKPAYAQNFLVAQGLGRVATPEVLEQLERERQEAFEAALAAKQEAQALADKLKTVFADGAVIKKRTGPKGDIFGKVTSADVAQLIKDKTQAAVDRRKIKVPDIKGAGSANAELQLHKEVKATLKVVVVAAD